MTEEKGVRRPTMYALVGALAIALALPLALGSGQTKIGGMFDECYESNCSTVTTVAELKD